MAMANGAVWNRGERGYINAHVTSTELNYKYDTLAIHQCFGPLASSCR
jgi:3-oxoacyl-(acyl-carrier-protein) synthase